MHMDNGWNAELATNNISNLIKGLGVDLKTHVINWEEYKGLMECFFKANVIDIELLYDNAMIAVNYQAAIEQKLVIFYQLIIPLQKLLKFHPIGIG